MLHAVSVTAYSACSRITSGYYLAEDGEIRIHSEIALSSAGTDPEAGDYLVKDQESAIFVGKFFRSSDEFPGHRPGTAFRSHRLHINCRCAAGQLVLLKFALQIIQIAWTRDEQEKSQREILQQAGLMLDRLYHFYADFDEIGKRLEKAQESFRTAAGRLRGGEGRHGIVPVGEKLKKLGVKLKKDMPLPASLREPGLPPGDPEEPEEAESAEEPSAAAE